MASSFLQPLEFSLVAVVGTEKHGRVALLVNNPRSPRLLGTHNNLDSVMGKLVAARNVSSPQSLSAFFPYLWPDRLLEIKKYVCTYSGKSRKYPGVSRYRQGLSQWNPSSSATKR
jgi:hypothetical protein